MPGNSRIYITPGVFFYKASCGAVVVVHIENCLLQLTSGAGELLVGYLKVIKAYFTAFKNHRELTNEYYREIAKQLNPKNSIIRLKEISSLIQQMGCISDWEYHHKNQPE